MRAGMLLGFSIPTILVFLCVVFAVLWYRQRSKTHIAMASAACALAFMGFVASQLLIEKESVLNVLVAQPMLLGALFLFVAAACKRTQIDLSVLPFIVCAIFGLSASVWATLYFDTLNIRSLINNLTLASFFGLGAWFQLRERLTRTIDRLLAHSFLGVAIYFGWLGMIALLAQSSIDGFTYHSTMYWFAMNVFGGIAIMAFASCLISAIVSDSMDEAVEAARLDALTGLKTRSSFDTSVSNLMSKVHRTPLPISLIIADIDNFKAINDTYGHQAGDKVISAFGSLIEMRARESDIVGRIGGEEFAVVLWNAHANAATLFAEEVRTAFSSCEVLPISAGEAVSASFGVAELQPEETFENLFKRADQCLYKAKHQGRDRVVVSEQGTVAGCKAISAA